MANSADVGIIGAGPIGIELAIALKQAGVSTIHIEAGEIGATFGWWAAGTRFFSSPERIAIAGVPLVVHGQEKATREDYRAYLRAVVQQFDLKIQLFERVVSAERAADGGFILRTAPSAHGVGGPAEESRAGSSEPARDAQLAEHRVRRLVLAIGNMHRPRRLGVPGEDLPHVSHYLADPHDYFGRRVLIVGGKNSAVEAAIRLFRVGAHVTMSYRAAEFSRDRVKYWLLPEVQWLIDNHRIAWRPSTVVRRITREHVILGPAGGRGKELQVEADAVLLLSGYVQDQSLFEMLGIRCEGHEQRPAVDHATMESNVPGVYVAGTAIGGCQTRTLVFIENAHEHVDRIVRAISGREVAAPPRAIWEGMEES